MRRRIVQGLLDAVAPHGETSRARRRLRSSTESERPEWLQEPGIQGFAVGRRVKGGRRQAEVVLTVYVARKAPRESLGAPVPARVQLEGLTDAVPTDVVEIGEVRRLSFTGREPRPVSAGVGLSHPRCGNGTFGCLVRRRGRPELYILSNAHVIADDGTATPGDPILQPCRDLGGEAADTIATFEQCVTFQFSETLFLNRVDAAIARVLRETDVQATIKGLGLPRGVSSTIVEDMTVLKIGSQTERTEARVVNTDFRIALPYKQPGNGVGLVGFREQVLCEGIGPGPFSAGGDSGAVVLDTAGRAVGLLFAGSDKVSIFNRMDSVLDELELELVTE